MSDLESKKRKVFENLDWSGKDLRGCILQGIYSADEKLSDNSSFPHFEHTELTIRMTCGKRFSIHSVGSSAFFLSRICGCMADKEITDVFTINTIESNNKNDFCDVTRLFILWDKDCIMFEFLGCDDRSNGFAVIEKIK